MITHAAYIIVIVFLVWKLIKAFDLVNIKHKELIRYKETIRVPYEIFSNYEKGYVNFYKWMVENEIDQDVIDKYDKLFKYDDGSQSLEEIERINKKIQN